MFLCFFDSLIFLIHPKS